MSAMETQGDPRFEAVVFSTSFEALLRTFGQTLPPPAREAFLSVGIDPDKPLRAAYPLDAFIRIVAWAAEFQFPGEDDAGYHKLGLRWFEGYSTTLMGKAYLSAMRLLGPKRVLQRARNSFRTASNYLESDATERGPGWYEIAIRPVRFPGLYHGILEAAVTVAGGQDVAVEPISFDGSEARFAVRWNTEKK